MRKHSPPLSLEHNFYSRGVLQNKCTETRMWFARRLMTSKKTNLTRDADLMQIQCRLLISCQELDEKIVR